MSGSGRRQGLQFFFQKIIRQICRPQPVIGTQRRGDARGFPGHDGNRDDPIDFPGVFQSADTAPRCQNILQIRGLTPGKADENCR